MTIPIRSQAELLDAIRARRDELNISHETIDDISGLPKGYTSKLLANPPMKNLGHKSLGDLMGALGMALVAVPDPEQIARVEKRWVKRKRPQRLAPVEQPSASTFSMPNEVPAKIEVTPDLLSKLRTTENMKAWGQMGGKKGSKRRMKVMGKRARQRVASHAARIRWSREKSA